MYMNIEKEKIQREYHRNSLCAAIKKRMYCIDGMRDQVGLGISINKHVSMRVSFVLLFSRIGNSME